MSRNEMARCTASCLHSLAMCGVSIVKQNAFEHFAFEPKTGAGTAKAQLAKVFARDSML